MNEAAKDYCLGRDNNLSSSTIAATMSPTTAPVPTAMNWTLDELLSHYAELSPLFWLIMCVSPVCLLVYAACIRYIRQYDHGAPLDWRRTCLLVIIACDTVDLQMCSTFICSCW